MFNIHVSSRVFMSSYIQMSIVRYSDIHTVYFKLAIDSNASIKKGHQGVPRVFSVDPNQARYTNTRLHASVDEKREIM